MLNIGLIGAGFMGQTHSDAYKVISLQKDIKLTGVCDIREEYAKKAALKHQAKVYGSIEEMINDKNIDVIDICLPTYLHFKYAKLAITNGKHVFIEKPVTLSVSEGEELIELEKKYNVTVMVGQCVRMWPSYVYLKDIYDSKKYGNLKRISLKRISSVPTWGYENWYQDMKKSGGAIFDLHIHDIDYMRYLLGEPENINCFGNDNYIISMFSYNNVLAEVENGWDFPKSYPVSTGFRADFDDATLVFQNTVISIYESGGKLIKTEPGLKSGNDFISESINGLGAYYYELLYFTECIEQKKENTIAPLKEGVKTLKLIFKEKERLNLNV